MQFYLIEGRTEDGSDVQDKSSSRQFHHSIYEKSREFNQKLPNGIYAFAAEIRDDHSVLGLICSEESDVKATIGKYVDYLGLPLKHFSYSEVTLADLIDGLNRSEREDFISDSDDVLDTFDLGELNHRHFGRGVEFGENLIRVDSEEEVYKRIDNLLATDTFTGELKRIYGGKERAHIKGHPAHYMIEVDNHDVRREFHQTLLSALYGKKRLKNRRYSFTDIDPTSSISFSSLRCLYKSNEGGTIIFRYNPRDDAEDDHASSGRETIRCLCKVMTEFRHRVLTIFCFPRECTKVKELFFDYLDDISFVELYEDLVDMEKAKGYLTGMAKKNHVRTDKKLFESLEESTGYLAEDIYKTFDKWYDDKLKYSIYPEYKDTISVKKEVKKAAPKGSAYEELMNMIGLERAKKVINQALDYSKAQKLFSDKGMKNEHLSMHMVFTGNPGTAKTSVARLFAQIMKENGVLSKGELFEVGRGDLIGKYVGWTAKIVKEKFKEAMGSVLFIDEAYSLVDDRDGSFGDEAINTIVQEMENHRDDVVVIFAGYPDKMEGFLQKNPGLRSRIAFHVQFDDYGEKELCEIAELIAKKKGLQFTEDAMEKLSGIFRNAGKQSDFGNGRFVRNVIEKAKLMQASRLLEMDLSDVTKKDITTITGDDIEVPAETKMPERKFGFCA